MMILEMKIKEVIHLLQKIQKGTEYLMTTILI